MEIKRGVSVLVFMVASIVGAGIFALPFTLAAHGLWVFVGVMVVAVWATVRIHDAVVQLSASTHKNLQLPGLVGLYLGKNAARITGILFFICGFMSLLVYVLGLHELAQTFIPELSLWYVALPCVVLGIVVSMRGEALVLRNAFFFSSLVFFLIVVISLLCVLHPQFSLVSSITPLVVSDISIIAVCFFALSGVVAIPELASMVRDRFALRAPVAVATILVAALYVFFSIAVVGILQGGTTSVATSGLKLHFGASAILVGALVTAASFLSGLMLRSLSLVESFRWDYGFSKFTALTIFGLVFVGMLQIPWHSFAEVVAWSGGVIGGLLGIIIMSAYVRMKYQKMRTRGSAYEWVIVSSLAVAFICFLALFGVV